ncbi:efflux RND transporter periplasmic adaptor subunit [Lentibacillus sp. CBA3610]|uniref:efflux RND transporter periplasmic adaptor subunit n=1 Tax=Lentibacillus sp. CBA3610 TaxID=2518176 RepID=UPI001595C906|nr:HlyD family efflux transporter periplasmic adaptor subunit [Lentibacillus sp. CBA3610]QKY70985.1 HlyD family efflux transporter periplasmic adaptor subunit [Lentibacillus sp. CBA3610]
MSRRKLILTVVVLFMGINIFLVYLDDDANVPRVSYIENWSKTAEKDMYETIETTGVLSAVEEKNVYFDQDQGTFQEFVVEEGTTVNTGDQLFTYRVDHYAETMTDLESEQQKLTGEIQAIEAALASISAHQIPDTDMDTVFEDENSTLEMTSRSVEANYMKEQYLAEKERELAQKEAELQSIQSRISDLQTTGETITVESPYDGEVIAVSESLDNPVVTIRDLQLQAEGELSEAERMEVEQGMPVEVDITESDAILQGALSEISDTPEATSVHGSSVYPFAASLENEAGEADESGEMPGDDASEEPAEGAGQTEDLPEIEESPQAEESVESTEAEQSVMEDLLPGYHADVTITTKEAAGATVVSDDQLTGGHLWKMTSTGLLDKQPVEAGLKMDGLAEITDGANTGEMVADSYQNQFRDGARFITPLKLSDIEWQDPGKYDNVNWKRYFVIGLLSR